MIKFFRKIRQTLVKDNRLGKYLLYASGEIILVVIGILIALQINNWNENNKTSLLEKIYLSNIADDLHDQLTSIDDQIDFETNFSNSSLEILTNFYNNTLTLDSVFFNSASILIARKTFITEDATYTDLISSGNIKVLSNKKMKNQIIKYYQELERFEKIIQNNNSLLVDQVFSPIYLERGYLSPTAFEGLELLTSRFKVPVELNSQSGKLKETSIQKLNSPDDLLTIINAITQRYIVATGHANYLKNLREKTEQLISILKESDL